ncbi:MAG: hypothetical protein AAFU64_09015 [Bacteroidota bacterium]
MRGIKGEVYEGGVKVPFLISWPDHLPPGQTRDPIIADPIWTIITEKYKNAFLRQSQLIQLM